MSEKRFVCIDIGYGDDWYITDNGKRLSEMEIVDLLNEQQATIEQLEKVNGENFAKRRLLEQHNLVLRNENEQLRKELQEKQEDEKLYAQEILELNKTKKEMLNFKQLGGDY